MVIFGETCYGEERPKRKCVFCGLEGPWICILKNPQIEMKDSGDVILCDRCMNLYANEKFEELQKRVESANN
jgi:hypothetical protein